MTTPTVSATPIRFQPKRLPPNLPDLDCESGIATVPLAQESHLPQWQPEIPERYLQMEAQELIERIEAARAELGSRLLILAHHYQRDDVFRFADFQGDSFGLSREAASRDGAEFIIFCGVHFMAESADILTRPEQAVILPNMAAGCSMSDMADPDDVYRGWEDLSEVVAVEDVVPITYMNSAAALKAFVGRNGGAVCTSSNASAVLEWAFERGKHVFFFPDQHLGRNTAKQLGIEVKSETAVWNPRKPLGGLKPERIPQTKVLLWQGHCSVHVRFKTDQISKARADYPGCKIVVHPECSEPVVDAADASGSTSFIIDYVRKGEPGVYAVGTEINLVHRLHEELKDEGKTVFCLDPVVCPCATMYRIHPAYLAWVTESLLANEVVNRITVDDETREWATVALERMLAIR